MSSLDKLPLRAIDSIYPSKEALEKRLSGKDKLRIYFGIDPTGAAIHLGHAVPLLVLRRFQLLGHEIVLVFGDFTGLIGDPSGQDSQRKPLTKSQIQENVAAYQNQVKKILDFAKNPPKISYNSQWWGKMKPQKIFELFSRFTLSQLIERDMFQKRLVRNRPIAISEFLYPLLQGYDSVALDTDIEIGATDQTFNMLIGREMLKNYQHKEKIVITTPLLEGLDGRKMSKSYANTIDINLKPVDMFGKLMSIKDELIVKYLELTTLVPEEAVTKIAEDLKSTKIHPMAAKKRLAYEVVRLYNGATAAKKAQEEFERVFQKGGVPKARRFSTPREEVSPLDFLVESGLVTSRSEAKRLITQGGVEINKRKVTDPFKKVVLTTGSLARVGKLKAVEIVVEEK